MAKLPDDILEQFRKWGAEGGAKGGKKRWKRVPAAKRSRMMTDLVRKRWAKRKASRKSGAR